jgi:hypothetical protein
VITFDDVADLVAFAAVFDQRKAGEIDVKAWLAVAQAQRWTREAAQRVILEHYSAGADRPRIDPARITDRLRTLRGRAAESFEALRIPDGLPNHEYPQWLRAQLRRHVDALVERWATTGDEPPRAIQQAPAQVRSLPDLVARAPEHARPALERGARQIAARRVRLDPDRRAEARAELDAARRDEPPIVEGEVAG